MNDDLWGKDVIVKICNLVDAISVELAPKPGIIETVGDGKGGALDCRNGSEQLSGTN